MPAGFLTLLIYHVCILKLYVFLVINVPLLDNLIELTQTGVLLVRYPVWFKMFEHELTFPTGLSQRLLFFFCSVFWRVTIDLFASRHWWWVLFIAGLLCLLLLYTQCFQNDALVDFFFPPMLNYLINNNLIIIYYFKIALKLQSRTSVP